MNKCLIVIDVQNDFVTGALANPLAEKALPKVKEIVDYAVENKWNLIFTQDTHFEDYMDRQEGKNLPVPHCLKDSWGWQIVDGIVPNDYRKMDVIRKGSFGYANWDYIDLDFYDEIVVVGFVSSICVCSNILSIKAVFPEVPVTFISDASAGLSEENHAAACEILRSCQVNVVDWNGYKKN